jgi:hypothetical protein
MGTECYQKSSGFSDTNSPKRPNTEKQLHKLPKPGLSHSSSVPFMTLYPSSSVSLMTNMPYSKKKNTQGQESFASFVKDIQR